MTTSWCSLENALSGSSVILGEKFQNFKNIKNSTRDFPSYDDMIKATGRYFCDFLQSVDNIHLQMRFTYRKMKSPSMQITDIDQSGAVLIYRSSRSGFSKYLMGMKIICTFQQVQRSFLTFSGQLLEIAKEIYNLDLKIKIIDAENDTVGGTIAPIDFGASSLKSVVVKFRLDFDNSDYVNILRSDL